MEKAEPCRIVAVGDSIISEQGLVAIIGRDRRYHVCGAAHTFEEANKLVRQHRPGVLLIEPFLENRDAIRWIKDLAMEFPHIRILVVSRQSERTYAERALRAGASGYWMMNSSMDELMRAIETVLVGGRPVVRNGKLVTVDEATLAAEVEKIAPAFRRDAQALAGRNADLTAPLLNASREAWKVPLGFERYIGRGTS